ncbi:MAG TPA: glycosyltransferase family 4 protein [Tepidisphaeraceae bacterium]|jgi:glycosyltransferase involved in cell wall biosynthesis|nr:glycosyltransferase family 4 protein [Tepidisphaeraceae bacterium]
MRLTLINQFYTPDVSPTAHLAASLAEHRAAQGDCVTVLTSRTGYINASAMPDAESAVRVERLWSTRLGSRSNLRRLIDWLSFYIPTFHRAITMPRQDVVIALTTPPFIALAGWLHKLLNPSAKFVLWNMDVYPEALERTNLVKPNSIVSRVMRSANRAIFRKLDHLVCLDGAMADLLLSQYMPGDRMVPHTIIPNWEAMELFPTFSPPRGRRKDFIVLYLGNAGYGHEFKTLLDAADLLGDTSAKFLFIGGGALTPWIKTQCESRGLSHIVLRDYIPKSQTPTVMRQADCALITLENTMLGVMSPSKLHSNLAMGLPIIYVGPQGGNVDEAITQFGCGISLRPGNAREFADFVRQMINDRDALLEMKRRARNAFEQAYCDRRTLPMFDRVIADIQATTVSTAGTQ